MLSVSYLALQQHYIILHLVHRQLQPLTQGASLNLLQKKPSRVHTQIRVSSFRLTRPPNAPHLRVLRQYALQPFSPIITTSIHCPPIPARH
jgi:hypothetical protein